MKGWSSLDLIASLRDCDFGSDVVTNEGFRLQQSGKILDELKDRWCQVDEVMNRWHQKHIYRVSNGQKGVRGIVDDEAVVPTLAGCCGVSCNLDGAYEINTGTNLPPSYPFRIIQKCHLHCYFNSSLLPGQSCLRAASLQSSVVAHLSILPPSFFRNHHLSSIPTTSTPAHSIFRFSHSIPTASSDVIISILDIFLNGAGGAPGLRLAWATWEADQTMALPSISGTRRDVHTPDTPCPTTLANPLCRQQSRSQT